MGLVASRNSSETSLSLGISFRLTNIPSSDQSLIQPPLFNVSFNLIIIISYL